MTQLGKYELHGQLGKGGFGTVYRATDTSLGREVALKVLHPQLMVDDEFIERFKKEARTMASLEHPSIVSIYEFGEIDGRVFISMRYLPGGSLQKKIHDEGALPYEKVRTILYDICEGLQVAHEQGLVHRDIKPGNILFDKPGRAVVSDFGLARAVQLSGASSSLEIAGTPAYRAPELWRGKPPATPATDVYSLGCVLAEMLTGRVLFDGDTTDEILTQHLIDKPSVPQSYAIGTPAGIRSVIEKSLAKDPQDRYQTAGEFENAWKKLDERVRDIPVKVPQIREEPVKTAVTPKLEAESSLTAANPPVPPREDQLPPKSTSKSKAIWYLIGAATLIVLFLISKGITNGVATKSIATTAPILAATVADSEVPVSTQISPKDRMTIVYVPAGDFLMGSPSGVGNDDEHPQHTVTLSAFWIDQTEVTNTMFTQFVNETNHQTDAEKSGWSYIYIGSQWEQVTGVDWKHPHGPDSDLNGLGDYPVVHVSWNDASTYCQWAGGQLPTEAQWEKAARGKVGQTYPWGNEPPTGNLVNFADVLTNFSRSDKSINDGYAETAPVGSYEAGKSPYGAYDMAGNVMEWVNDWHSANYDQNSQSIDPQGPSTGDFRVLRGGSWDADASGIRSTIRDFYNQSDSSYLVGFRCAFSASISP